MKDAISASSPSDDCQDVLKNPLPGDDSTWDRSPLGHFHQWPVELRNYALTISQLTYAAAIYWHHDLVLIHNYAWVEAGGLPSQGQVQRHSLPKTTVAVLKSILATGLPRHIHDKDVMRSDMIPRRQSSIAIGSPLLPQNDASGGAVMVQLLPQPMLAQAFNDRVDEREIHGNRDTSGRGDGSGSTMPIDQHPFFRRFAELLPSGLAILDHNARAVFVNQHFYDLTTLLGDGKNFTSWPQSIHDDDYERVMDAYREAFESRKELRTASLHSHHLPAFVLTLDRNFAPRVNRTRGDYSC
jgi:PAS domain-containing protein